jgi:hypothetical protein
LGVRPLISLTCLQVDVFTPASWAMAGRWSMVLVEQPRAMSMVSALWKAAFRSLCRGAEMLRSESSMICMPVFLASRSRAERVAGMVPLPRSAMPMASVRQFMELAVYMPEQEPQVGQAFSYIFLHSVFVQRSGVIGAHGLEHVGQAGALPSLRCPASMGPPEQKMAGCSAAPPP